MAIFMSAQYQIQPESLQICLDTIREFIESIRENESGTLVYTAFQDKKDKTRFLHTFIFKNEADEKYHRETPAVKKFTDILYPYLIEEVRFNSYEMVASTKPFWLEVNDGI